MHIGFMELFWIATFGLVLFYVPKLVTNSSKEYLKHATSNVGISRSVHDGFLSMTCQWKLLNVVVSLFIKYSYLS